MRIHRKKKENGSFVEHDADPVTGKATLTATPALGEALPS
jgi:hypothetical protein